MRARRKSESILSYGEIFSTQQSVKVAEKIRVISYENKFLLRLKGYRENVLDMVSIS